MYKSNYTFHYYLHTHTHLNKNQINKMHAHTAAQNRTSNTQTQTHSDTYKNVQQVSCPRTWPYIWTQNFCLYMKCSNTGYN